MIGLVHLVWAPLGPDPLREFLRSYHAHPSGVEHELSIVVNGAESGGDEAGRDVPALLAELDETRHRLIRLEHPMLDLAAYAAAARSLEHDSVCFLNSYSVILADGWLRRLSAALERPDVGLVGATGSWESQAEWVRGRARHWPQQLAALRPARRDYPRFPNPHIRTTGFMLDRRSFMEIAVGRAASKRATYLLESGRRSITRQIQEKGLRALVVGRAGLYEVEQWPASRTFRGGEQENLLVADNQTRAYQMAAPGLRRRLSRDSWGTALDVARTDAGNRPRAADVDA